MTPTDLANALRNVEIANEETNYTKFQSDAAIVEEAAMLIEKQAEEIKDLRAFAQEAYDQAKAYKAAYKGALKQLQGRQ